MSSRRRMAIVGAGCAAMVTTWAAGQLLLGLHTSQVLHAHEVSWLRQMRQVHPGAVFGHVHPVETRAWVLPAVAGLIALLSCLVTSTGLLAGGRRPWALLPAVFPLTLFLSLRDGNSLGLSWFQPFAHLGTWLAVGAVTDAVVVLALAAAVARAVPRRAAPPPVLPALLRTLPIAVIAFGWWLVGRPLPDPHDRLFVTHALLLVLAAGVIATLRLPTFV